MKLATQILLGLWAFILLMGFAMASDFTPQGDINLRDVYSIKNGVNVTASYFIGDGNKLTNLTINESDVLHNNLSGLQGGNTSEYYHLNVSEHTSVVAGIISWITSWLIPDSSSNYLSNDSTAIYFNETKLNETIEALDTDTIFYAGGFYIYKNISDYFILNETQLNLTIDNRENDTKYDAGDIYIYLDGTTFRMNETKLNLTIEDLDTFLSGAEVVAMVGNWSADKDNYYSKTEIDDFNSSMASYVDEQDVIFNDSMRIYVDNTFINQSSETNLNVNSSTWWAGISGWVSGWFEQAGDDITFNETKLNETIDNRENDTFVDEDCPSGQFVQNISGGDTLQCATPAGGGDITGVTAGPGLIGGGLTGTVELNVSAAICGAGELSKYNGSEFSCEIDIGNASWNESYADTLYADIKWGYNMSDGSYNATYDLWAYNQTADANDYTDEVNLSNYNWIELTFLKIVDMFTKSEITEMIDGNVTAINTTANIQGLLNATGIYSTYNSSYVPYTGATSDVDLGAHNLTATNGYYSGNLGVGDSTPNYKIHAKTNSGSCEIASEGTSTTGQGIVYARSNVASVYFSASGSSRAGSTFGGVPNANVMVFEGQSVSNMVFSTWGGLGASFIWAHQRSNDMELTNGGNLLIGKNNTYDTGEKLQVEGDAYINGNLNATNNITTNDYLKFGDGGYMYDNGTALVLGHN